ncbi:MAG TPA: hypothetical protein ENJ19_08370 [Gammaproteobacteria bacterium]|nr:hypothetical protein [Gammaproteobacteria bacterium]
MRRVAVLWVLLWSGAVAAEAEAEGLQRLFTTAPQRYWIEHAPRGADGEAGSRTGPAKKTAAAGRLRLLGTLRGSDGRQRVWLRGSSAATRVRRVLDNGAVLVMWRHRPQVLMPGQVLELQSGRVVESYRQPAPAPQSPADAGPGAGGGGGAS